MVAGHKHMSLLGMGGLGIALFAAVDAGVMRVADRRDRPRARHYDAHYIAWREHQHNLWMVELAERKRLKKLARDKPILDAAEAKRARKAAKRARSAE